MPKKQAAIGDVIHHIEEALLWASKLPDMHREEFVEIGHSLNMALTLLSNYVIRVHVGK